MAGILGRLIKRLNQNKYKDDEYSWTIWMHSEVCKDCKLVPRLHCRNIGRVDFRMGVCHNCGSRNIEDSVARFNHSSIYLSGIGHTIIDAKEYQLRGESEIRKCN
jgi:hypothetical protein